MKHAPLLIDGETLENRMSHYFDALEMPAVEMADALGLRTGVDDKGYPVCPQPTGWWEVTWPEHVLMADFNSDASYRRLGDTLEQVARDAGLLAHRVYGLGSTLGGLVDDGTIKPAMAAEEANGGPETNRGERP